jgi:hypothetical protein
VPIEVPVEIIIEKLEERQRITVQEQIISENNVIEAAKQ